MNATPSILSEGYQEAVPHWNNFHARPQNTPTYLEFFDSRLRDEFDELYGAFLQQACRSSPDIQWDDGVIAAGVRQVFETLGKRIQAKKPTTSGLPRKSELYWSVRLGVSFRLFARLPIDEGKPGHAVFCPAAALPTKRWLDDVLQQASTFKSDGDDLAIVCARPVV